MSADSPRPEPRQIGFKWEGIEDLPVMGCNVFVAQFSPHEFLLTFGYAAPPLFFKPPSPQEIAAIDSVPAKATVRLTLSPGRMAELIQVLQQNLSQFQQAQISGQVGQVKH
jgi:hypothetical protein